jgi:hypothetical protein
VAYRPQRNWAAAKESGLTALQHKKTTQKTTQKQRLPGLAREKEFR